MLKCPKTNEVRYIGQTIRKLNDRLSKHKSEIEKYQSHKNSWLKQLKTEGLLDQLQIQLIEETEAENLSVRETFWIKVYTENGHNLTNTTSGGEVGSLGHKHTIEAKQKISEAGKIRKGIKLSKITKAKISKSLLGNTRRKGKPFSQEQKSKISKALQGRRAWNTKKVNQFTLDGAFVKTWESVKLAEKTLKIRNVSEAARNLRRSHAGGYVWRYV